MLDRRLDRRWTEAEWTLDRRWVDRNTYVMEAGLATDMALPAIYFIYIHLGTIWTDFDDLMAKNGCFITRITVKKTMKFKKACGIPMKNGML